MKRILRVASLLLPQGVNVLRQKYLSKTPLPRFIKKALFANKVLHGRHAGQRCFILGNGPSVKALDLSLLKGETIFSVSNGYLHEGYASIAPRYHCLPQITYGRMTRADVIAWFTEMHQHLGDAELFLNETEAALVQELGLFTSRKVHYLALRESFDELVNRDVINISEPVPRVESVPIMALMIAMYMGFSEIVLLGVDHDHFKTGQYVYAFDPKTQKNKDFSVSNDGQVLTSRHDDFQSLARLWRQYRVLREIAEKKGIGIVNATPGGELDEFPRIPLQSIIRDRQ